MLAFRVPHIVTSFMLKAMQLYLIHTKNVSTAFFITFLITVPVLDIFFYFVTYRTKNGYVLIPTVRFPYFCNLICCLIYVTGITEKKYVYYEIGNEEDEYENEEDEYENQYKDKTI